MTRQSLAVLAAVLCLGPAIQARAARAQAAMPAVYADENGTDPAPLNLHEIEGKVVGLGGDSMPQTAVSIFTEDGHTLVATVKADREGKFRFDKIDKGLYRVVARVQGLCPANIPVKVESSLLAKHKLIITMRPKDLDTCSYGVAK